MVTGSERQFLDRLLIRVQQGNIEKTVKTALSTTCDKISDLNLTMELLYRPLIRVDNKVNKPSYLLLKTTIANVCRRF